jgi:hypothetical protein
MSKKALRRADEIRESQLVDKRGYASRDKEAAWR